MDPNPQIYLASRSPRRRELLTQMGVRFGTVLFRASPDRAPDVDETPKGSEDPLAYVQRVVKLKASRAAEIVVARHLPPLPVLTADTTVTLDGKILGTPKDAAEAADMLTRLANRTHRVLTAVAVGAGGRLVSATSVSEVTFAPMSADDISLYIGTGEPLDKAGAYGIQGRGAMFVSHLVGSYSGVMGLPIFETAKLLRGVGVL